MSSPDGTFGTSIVDAQGRTWGLGPNGETAIHVDRGVGRLLCFVGQRVYVKGLPGNDNWYILEPGDHWRGPVPLPIPEPGPPPFESLPRLTVRGDRFARETGERWTIIECTDFQLYHRYLRLEDIRPVLDQRAALGFNMVRVLGMCHGMFHLYPREHPQFYDELGPFCDSCASFGLYVEFIVFADATMAMPRREDQTVHWLSVGGVARPSTNILLEVVNEANQPINKLDALAGLMPISGVLCSHGSNGSQAQPAMPWWNYETFHTNGAPEWWRKGGHNGREFSQGDAEGKIVSSRVPVLVNENTRFPDQDGNPNHIHDASWGCSGLVGGSAFHSPEGKSSTLWTGASLAGAQAHVAGARKFNLEFQDGRYSHVIADERPDELRVYRMTLPDGRVEFIRIRK